MELVYFILTPVAIASNREVDATADFTDIV